MVRDEESPSGPFEISESEGTPSVPSWKTDSDQPCTALSDKDIQRNSYNKKIYMCRYDKRFKENLLAMAKVGCLDFEANLSALKRTGNKFDHAVNDLVDEIE